MSVRKRKGGHWEVLSGCGSGDINSCQWNDGFSALKRMREYQLLLEDDGFSALERRQDQAKAIEYPVAQVVVRIEKVHRM